ncbi:MAG TPA: TPM domain-containing protein [Thermoanaerobaculia bacterium]|nr:TPM domain-containing protein [Thermoanaerobaculia bacterium]
MSAAARTHRLRAGLAVAAALLISPAAAGKDVPYLTGRVVDEPGLLSAAAKQKIDGELAALERQTGDQVAVLIVASLGGEPLEEYSVKVAQTWKLGQKGKDNGILLFISRDDRKMRIEVGYGLEAKLTDLQSHEILDAVITPRFRQADFDGGVEQGVDAIVKVLHGEPLPPRPAAAAAGTADMPAGDRLIFTLVFGLVFVVVVGTFSVVAVASRGFQSWFLYVFLTPFYIAFPTAVAGPTVALVFTALWLVGFPILKHTLGRRGSLLAAAGHHRGGFWGGFIGAASGGMRGGGSSGGGFSGGGGSFGGGGASGGW